MGSKFGPKAFLGWLVVGLAGSLLIVGAAYLGFTETAWGRARVCDKLNATISHEIAGRLEVKRIDSLSLTRVKAMGITIFAPNEEPAIEADTADIEFDPWGLLQGHYGWQRAEVHGGRVHVTEDARGKINMEEVFRARHPEPARPAKPAATGEAKGDDTLDLKNMVTSDIVLIIAGGSLPRLKLVNLYGIMRVHVLGDGTVELRFDEYRGIFEKGLPTGKLVFREVKGHVDPSNRRLLHFTGSGKSEGAEVTFKLDIHTKPKTRVEIDALFPELSLASLSALGVATWSKASPTLDLNVRFGR